MIWTPSKFLHTLTAASFGFGRQLHAMWVGTNLRINAPLTVVCQPPKRQIQRNKIPHRDRVNAPPVLKTFRVCRFTPSSNQPPKCLNFPAPPKRMFILYPQTGNNLFFRINTEDNSTAHNLQKWNKKVEKIKRILNPDQGSSTLFASIPLILI